MIIAYGLISRELYGGIQFELQQKKGHSGKSLFQNQMRFLNESYV